MTTTTPFFHRLGNSLSAHGPKFGILFTVLYLLIEIGYKGYAVDIVAQNDILAYELDILKDYGRVLSSLGFALVVLGFGLFNKLTRYLVCYCFYGLAYAYTKNVLDFDYPFFVVTPATAIVYFFCFRNRLSQALIFFLMAWLIQALLFERLERLVSQDTYKLAPSVNLYRAIYRYIDDPKFIGLVPDRITESGFKAYSAAIPFIFAGNHTLAQLVEQQPYRSAGLQAMSEQVVGRYDSRTPYKDFFIPYVNNPIVEMIKSYRQARSADFEPIFYQAFAQGFESSFRAELKESKKLRQTMPKSLKAAIERLNSYRKKGETPPRAFVVSTIQQGMRHIHSVKDYGLKFESSIDFYLRKLGLEPGRAPNFKWEHYSYQEMRNYYHEMLNVTFYYNIGKLIDKISRELTSDSYYVGGYSLPSRSESSIAELFASETMEQLLADKLFMLVTDGPTLYRIIASNTEDGYEIFDHHLKQQFISSYSKHLSDQQLQARITVLIPIIMIFSTLAILTNLISLISKLHRYAKRSNSRLPRVLAVLPSSALLFMVFGGLSPFISRDDFHVAAFQQHFAVPAVQLYGGLAFVGMNDRTDWLYTPPEKLFRYWMVQYVEAEYVAERRVMNADDAAISQRKLELKQRPYLPAP